MVKLIWLILSVLFLIRTGWFYGNQQIRREGEIVELEGYVESEPNLSGNSQKFKVAGISVSSGISPEVHYGDRVKIEGKMMCYEMYRCIKGSIVRAKVTQLGSQKISPLLQISNQIKNRIKSIYYDGLRYRQANLMSGIVLGSIDLDRNFRNDLASAGLSHVVAASGMNVTLFVTFIFFLFTAFHLTMPQKVWCSVFAVIIYAEITGFAPSVVRASIMACMVLIGKLVGRKNSSMYGLAASGYLMLWAYPSLIFDYGFLLSFTSMAGQIFVSTLTLNLPKWATGVTSMIVQNLAAVVFTLPIILVGFARFSLVSTISNVLVLWTVEPLMLLGGVAGILGMVFPELSKVILFLTVPLLDYFLWIVKFFSADVFVVKVPGFNLLLAVGYYLLLIAGIYHHKTRQTDRLGD